MFLRIVHEPLNTDIMILENARLEEVIIEQGDRKGADGNPLIGEDGQVQKWTRRKIRVRQSGRNGDAAVLDVMRAVEENQDVMERLIAGAIVTVEVGMGYREHNGRYYNELAAWHVDIVQDAGF